MNFNNYATHLNIEFDADKIMTEKKFIDFVPFSAPSSKFEIFHYQPRWRIGKVTDFENCKEINRINEFLKDVTGTKDIRPRIFEQDAGFEVPYHQDLGTLCSINMILDNAAAPITFEDVGDFSYKCALLNLQKQHMVKAFEQQRNLLKFSIFDLEFNEVKEKLQNLID
jgi:hypothetical protein